MVKRSHSELLPEDSSKLFGNGSLSKKQRIEESHTVGNDSIESGKNHKDNNKDKIRHKSKLDGLVATNGNSHVKSPDALLQVQHPDAIQNGAIETDRNDISDGARKKEKRRKRKEREALASASANGVAIPSPKKSSSKEERAEPDDPGADETVNSNGIHTRKSKRDKSEKKTRRGANGEKQSQPTGSVAWSDELSRDIPPGVPASKTNSIAPPSEVAAAALSQRYGQNTFLTEMPKSQIDSFLASNFITVSDPLSAGYRPITKFAYLPEGTDAQHEIFKSFPSPTPIQAAAWPFLFAGRDVVGIAETGSGKTIAFGLPCMKFVTSHATNPKKGRGGVKAVVVSPTRELALQIYEQFTKLAVGTKIQVVCVYGGVPKDDQRTALKTASIIVATPGRLNDFLQEGAADLRNVGYVVLDEADRMLDKGFEDEIRKIISTVPTSTCQTAMFTATWPQSIRELAATFMKDPVKIAIGDNPSGDLRANARVTQLVEVVDPYGKETRLLQLLKQYQSGKNKDDRILVFCLYKKEATRIENFIHSKGFRVAGIHGDLNQSARTASLEAFKSGKVPILVATDVAARGLDIPSVKLVINVTFPLTAEDYVHRIGRTGRAGKDGLAITLFTEHDKAQSGPLINVLKAAKQDVPEELLKFGTTVKKKAHEAYGAFYKDTGEDPKKATKITFD